VTTLNSMTTWGGNSDPVLYRRRSVVADAPVPSLPEYGVSGASGTHQSVHAFAAGAFARGDQPKSQSPSVKVDAAKIDVLNATVKNVGETFLVVSASPGGEPVEIQIPIILCPTELRLVGMPLAISVDKESKYSSLKIERREKQNEMSEGFRKRFEAMTEWANSL